MSLPELPRLLRLRVTQSRKAIDQGQLASVDHLLLIFSRKPGPAAWKQLPFAEPVARALKRKPLRMDTPAVTAVLPNKRGTLITVACVRPGNDTFGMLTAARRLITAVTRQHSRSLAVSLQGFGAGAEQRLTEAVVSAAMAASLEMPNMRGSGRHKPSLQRLRLHDRTQRIDIAPLAAAARGNNLARWLTALPPNVLTASTYRTKVETLAREFGWSMEFYDEAMLRKENAGAFLAVAQACPDAGAGIVRLRTGPRQGAPWLTLVGKGVCFDTGGVNLKSAKYMQGMHEDMQGSAVALGTFLALGELGVNKPIECWLALTENRIGAAGYTPQDVIRASNGVTIEVIHSDAEGRMALADTLAMASRAKPRLIIDYATLTGSCITALTPRYSGIFTNNAALFAACRDAGADSGERVWPFPMDADFDIELRSKIADVKQCSLDGDGDHILAARFLSRFVADGIPWMHVDLSAGNHKGGLAHIPTDITGFGVRYTLELLDSPRVRSLG